MISAVKVEQQTLNCIWDQPSRAYEFDQPYFVSEVAKDIFFTMQRLYESNVDINVNELVAQGNDRNAQITKENLEALRKQEYDPDSFEFYFTSLKKNYARSNIENVLLKETLVEVSKKGELNVPKIIELRAEIDKNLELIEGKTSALKTLEEIAVTYRGVLVKRKKGEYKFPTGDPFLDQALVQGYAPGEITTIFGATGVGKSTYVLNQINSQINKRILSLYLTLEMGDIPTMDRLMSIRQRVSSSMFQMKNEETVIESAFQILEAETERLKKVGNRFFLVDDPSIDLNGFEALVRKVQKITGEKYLVATIDLFTMISDVGQEAAMIEEGMNKLHQIVKRLGIHAVLVVQANRSADSARISTIEQVSNLRPSLNSIKNSQAIAERSRQVLGVFRPKYYASRLFPESEELELMDDILELQVLKQSAGRVGQILRYLYDAECFRCTPLVEELEEEGDE
jgi:replicative DNA helicase